MAARELASMFRKSGMHRLSSSAEEDTDLPTMASMTSNTGLLRLYLGPHTRRLAMLAAVGTSALVTFAVFHAVAPQLLHGHAAKQLSSPPTPQWAQLKQQLVVLPRCDYDTADVCPARTLFDNPEVHEVATESLMKVGHALLKPSDRKYVEAAVRAGFRNISLELQKRAPKVAKELGMVDLTEIQKNAVLNSMRLMGNPRVQSIGLDIGQAIHDSKSTHREDLRRYIQTRLQPRLGEIMKLRSELMPEPLRQLWGGGHQWTMTLDEENLRLMGAYRGQGKYGAIRQSAAGGAGGAAPGDLSPSEAKTYSILGGVLEEGRALLDIIELCAHLFGRHFEVPYWLTYLGGHMDVTSEFLSCEHHFLRPEDERLNSTTALFCPLKFGTQGMDALRAAFDMDGRGPYIPDTQFASPSLAAAPVVTRTTTAPPAGSSMPARPAPHPRLRIIGA